MSADTVANGKRPAGTIAVAASSVQSIGRQVEYLVETQAFTAENLIFNARSIRYHADEIEYAAVIIARQDGMSWEAIGAALGVSRQAAHEKYARRVTR